MPPPTIHRRNGSGGATSSACQTRTRETIMHCRATRSLDSAPKLRKRATQRLQKRSECAPEARGSSCRSAVPGTSFAVRVYDSAALTYPQTCGVAFIAPQLTAAGAAASQTHMSRDINPVHAEYDYETIGVAVLVIFKHVFEFYDFSFMLKVRSMTHHLRSQRPSCCRRTDFLCAVRTMVLHMHSDCNSFLTHSFV